MVAGVQDFGAIRGAQQSPGTVAGGDHETFRLRRSGGEWVFDSCCRDAMMEIRPNGRIRYVQGTEWYMADNGEEIRLSGLRASLAHQGKRAGCLDRGPASGMTIWPCQQGYSYEYPCYVVSRRRGLTPYVQRLLWLSRTTV